MNKNISLDKIYERDIDLLVMRLISTENSVLNYFCSQINIYNCSLKEVAHSVSDTNGESDIIVKLESNGGIHLLMIENKIDAVAQPEQYNRYKIRGEKQLNKGEINGYSICIMAPKAYLDENSEAQKYDYKVTYEDLMKLDAVKNESFAFAVFNKAVEKKKHGGEISESVSEFWKDYYLYQQQHYPLLKLNYDSTQKGPFATWPSFKTGVPGTSIIHKSGQGYVDLEFSGKGKIQTELAQRISPYKDEDMHWHPTGTSASIGIEVVKLDFTKPFIVYQEKMCEIFDAVNRLQRLVLRLYDDGKLS